MLVLIKITYCNNQTTLNQYWESSRVFKILKLEQFCSLACSWTTRPRQNTLLYNCRTETGLINASTVFNKLDHCYI